MSVWLRMAIVVLALAGIFVALRLVQTRPGLTRFASPELMRKAAHVASGLVTMSFPWVFSETWPVVALSALSLASMLAMRLLPVARDSVGRVVCSVERQSIGDLCFPIGVALTWILSDHDPALFVIPIGFLTLADAAAALIGKAHGTVRYRTTEGHKSVQGSLAFFGVGCIVCFVTLALLRDIEYGRILLIAALMGLLLMMCEAIAWRGVDNLVVPVLALALLQIYLGLDPPALGLRLAMLLALSLSLVVFRHRTTLIAEGAVAASLFLYAAWALGGVAFVYAPVLLVLCLLVLPRASDVPHQSIHGVGPAFALCAPGLACLILSRQQLDAAGLYAISFACATAVALLAQWHASASRFPARTKLALATLVGLFVGAGPLVMIDPASRNAAVLCAVFAATLIAACVSYTPALAQRFTGTRWGFRGVVIAGSTLLATAALLLGEVIYWEQAPTQNEQRTPFSQSVPKVDPRHGGAA